MNDSKKTVSETVDEQLEAAICTVLHFQIIFPPDFETVWQDAAVDKLSEKIRQDIIIWSKDHKGARLVYNAASQLPDGLEVPLL